jgi:purine nucleosidase
LAITVVWGNVPVEVAAASVLRVIHAAGRADVPVAIGEAGPIGPAPALKPASFIHGEDGLGSTGREPAPIAAIATHAVDVLWQTVDQRRGEVTLITLGPLSNVARAVADLSFAANVADLIVMGGSARRGGNALPAAEANVAHDPDAAHDTFVAAWPSPPLLVGLDVTHTATLTSAEFALLAEQRSAAARFLDEPLRFYARHGTTFTAPDCPCHDLLAVLACADPAIITDAPVLPLAVDRGGDAAWGATVVDFRAPLFAVSGPGARQDTPPTFTPWRIALGVDTARFRALARKLFGAAS